MRIKRFLLSMVLAFSLLLSLPTTVYAGNTTEAIRQMLNYYRYYQEDGWTDVVRLLEEMKETDPELAEDWRIIMEGWNWVTTQLEVTPGVVPEDLPQDDSLCIVVMGFQLNYDGTMKSELIGRLETALACAKAYPNAYILCTGGGTAYGNRYATEAGKMGEWLEDNGIDKSRIIIENRSYSTEQNALYSYKILRTDYSQVGSLILVSSDYHIPRCHVLFNAALPLLDIEDEYTILGNAAYDAGHEGDEGILIEAESIALMADVYVNEMARPTLSQLESITAEGTTEYMAGEPLELTITASYDTGVSRDVTDGCTFTGFDSDLSGMQIVWVEYTENGNSATTNIEVSIAPPPTEATTAPTEPPETALQTEAVAEATEEPEEDKPHIAILLVPLILAVLLACILNAHIQKVKRRRRRRRKKMHLE